MVKKGIILLAIVFSLVVSVYFVSGETFNNCWNKTGTSSATCQAVSGCVWKTQAQDSWCQNGVGCCMDLNCGMYSGNQGACTNSSDSLNCTWDSFMTSWYPNGTQAPNGGCMMNWTGSSGSAWGGVTEGCWKYNGDKASCGGQGASCKWTANGQNQNPWCMIKTLNDAQNKKPSATTDDIGCCETSGCWMHDNNETSCMSAFQGNCDYTNNTYGGGWCDTKSCSEITTQENCTYAKQNLYMPCNWTESACSSETYGGGGFGFYNDDADSCFSGGGWYNSTGGCIMPSGGSGGGGSGNFMFAGEAHCWFADNKPEICNNLTGCAYCVTGSGMFGVSNSSNNNICKNKPLGLCEGHDTNDINTYANANNSANLACTDIKIKTACNYGPLPNCKWTNSSVINGSYCEAGASTEKKSAPPVQYCEDSLSKNNYSLCMQLANSYMMPCKWDNSSYPVKNCTFNSQAVFGTGIDKDFNEINSQFSCTSAGGTWSTEYYVDGAVLKQDSWCEMTGFFDIGQKTGQGNKGSCNTSCWACEFQTNGSVWGSASLAETACESSTAVGGQAGGCVWKNDSSGLKAFNGLGWCDYPKEMENGGAKDCNLECEGCNFMGNPLSACTASVAGNGTGCKWVNDSSNSVVGGYCVDKGKKTCSSDCFSCYDFNACANSSLDCNWDQTFNLCSPNGFKGEVCFDGVDNDQNSLIDCADPNCAFDNFCGGSVVGGSCFSKTTQGTCNSTVAFGELNCTWLNDTWNPGWCDMPGANCWKFNDNLNGCGATPGCTNSSSSMGTNSWCEMNSTKMDSATCWAYNSEATCSGNCQWKNNTWMGASSGSGWCEYAPFARCSNLNQSSCGLNTNCTWKQDQFSAVGGWCDIACFNQNLNQASCENVSFNGLCKWRNMSQTCQPSTFMMMGSSGGVDGKKGCWQYDGNQTGCVANNITCTYKNDTYSRNNKSVSEPSGWCMDKSEFQQFGETEGNIIELAMDNGNVLGSAESGVDGQIDIMGMGMRVSDEGFNFGAEMFNISRGIICNGNMIGSMFGQTPVQGTGNATTRFYWYLDTNGNSSGGCVAVPSSGSNMTGYDFVISYVSRNTSSGIVETKQLMKCSNGNWTLTNAQITTSKKLSCGEIGGVMIALTKQDIESFAEYNKTAVMKIFMSSANETGSRTAPSDSVGPGYYTPGTIDFKLVDCSDSDSSSAQSPKCKNFQKFGFNVFEECKNGVDDDDNDLVDCDDPFCIYMPSCASGSNAFNFSSNVNDKTAPSVMFSEVDKLSDIAFVRVDTDEPSNLSLEFYKNDSTCATANLNVTLSDNGTGYLANANFKPFHNVDLIPDTLGYSLTNSTAYYYKTKVCDPSGNCAISACSNFTTKSTTTAKSFIFKIELPEEGNYTVDIPAFNKTDYNFTESFGGQNYDVGIKTNTSITKNMNFTVSCGDGTMGIGFYGVNILEPMKIDLSNAFICNTGDDLIGMNSSLKKWNNLIDDLKLGGATDYIEVTIPVAYNTANTLNWTNDAGTNGTDVDDYVSCSGNSASTTCKVPVSMGFSAYTITTLASTPSTSSSSSSGGGGGGGNSEFWTNSFIEDDKSLENKGVITKELKAKERIKIKIGDENHSIGVISISGNKVVINVSSTPQQAEFSVGDVKMFEVTGDDYYDIRVKLNSVNASSNKTNVSVDYVHEKKEITGGSGSTGNVNQTNGDSNGNLSAGGEGTDLTKSGNSWIIWLVLGVIIIVGIVYFITRGKSSFASKVRLNPNSKNIRVS